MQLLKMQIDLENIFRFVVQIQFQCKKKMTKYYLFLYFNQKELLSMLSWTIKSVSFMLLLGSRKSIRYLILQWLRGIHISKTLMLTALYVKQFKIYQEFFHAFLSI